MTPLSERIQAVATLLRSAHHAIAFTGAGISTPSGIPDFRDPESGLWSHTDPLAVASIYGFRQNPQLFYDWVYPLVRQIRAAQPNPAHIALAQLEAADILKGVITQNIDMLHTAAGSQTVYEIHGSLRDATCTHCFKSFSGDALITRFLSDHAVPHCDRCGGVVKPNVILFGEQLPYRAMQAAQDAARRTDLMLLIGSSLEVAPASELPQIAQRHGAKLVIINLTATDFDQQACVVIHANAAEILPAVAACLQEAV